VRAVAARHDVYPSLVFNWRRQVREGRLTPRRSPGFVAVRLSGPSDPGDDQPRSVVSPEGSGAGGIEITLPDSTRLRILTFPQ